MKRTLDPITEVVCVCVRVCVRGREGSGQDIIKFLRLVVRRWRSRCWWSR